MAQICPYFHRFRFNHGRAELFALSKVCDASIKGGGTGPVTVVTTVATLLSGRTSRSLLLTRAVLVIDPAFVVMMVIVISAVAPLVKKPRLNLTTPFVWVQLPRLVVALTKVTSGGSVSVTATPVPSHSPLWLTFIEA